MLLDHLGLKGQEGLLVQLGPLAFLVLQDKLDLKDHMVHLVQLELLARLVQLVPLDHLGLKDQGDLLVLLGPLVLLVM